MCDAAGIVVLDVTEAQLEPVLTVSVHLKIEIYAKKMLITQHAYDAKTFTRARMPSDFNYPSY